MSQVEDKLAELGLELPTPNAPAPGRAGAVQIGNILFVGGHTPGNLHNGKLGAKSPSSRVTRLQDRHA